MIGDGDSIAVAKIFRHGSSGPESLDVKSYMAQGTTVLLALPAAFSPTCTNSHLPGYVAQAANILAAGADRIACLSVNDSHVMHAWGKQLGAQDAGIDMLADADADFTRKIGAEIDLSAVGMGTRSKRYLMIIKDGVVVHLAVEPNPGALSVSSAESALTALKTGGFLT